MGKKLILVGGGHAHMMILENIGTLVGKGFQVTVIGPSDYHYYSGMGPGMLGGTYSREDIRFATREVVEKQGGLFVRDRVVRVDPVKQQVFTQSDQAFDYDVVSFNAGSKIPMEVADPATDNVYPVKPIEKLWEAREKLKALFNEKKARVSIVGGGPSCAEVAGNVWQLARDQGRHPPEIQIFARRRFMGSFPEPVRSRVFSIIEKRGILIHENAPVQQVTDDKIILQSDHTFDTDFTFMAPGVRPSSIFEASGLPVGPDRGLLVNAYLQSVDHPNIFGGGDCIYFMEQPLKKVGVYAVRENPVLLHNVMAALEKTPLQPFDPGPDFLLIFNLGSSAGVLKKKGIVFGGRLAFKIKDYIDVKFMKKFQATETLISTGQQPGTVK